MVEEGLRGGDGEGGGLADVLAVDEDGAGLGTEALAAAVGTGGVAAVFGEEDADVELVLLAVELGEETADAGEGCRGRTRGAPAGGKSRSKYGTSVGMLADLAKRFISPCMGRYFSVVQGTMAPWSRVLERSAMMRLGSKSMVLPKPWQRGQAP